MPESRIPARRAPLARDLALQVRYHRAKIAKGAETCEGSFELRFLTVASRRVDLVSRCRQRPAADPAGHGGECLARVPQSTRARIQAQRRVGCGLGGASDRALPPPQP